MLDYKGRARQAAWMQTIYRPAARDASEAAAPSQSLGPSSSLGPQLSAPECPFLAPETIYVSEVSPGQFTAMTSLSKNVADVSAIEGARRGGLTPFL
jgi:hypothetical protein